MVEANIIIKIISIFGGTIIVGIIGFLLYMRQKNRSRFKFLLYSRDGRNAQIINGQVKVDPENKSKKTFIFDAYGSELIIKPPSLFIKNKPYRELTYTDDGELVYLEGKKIDRDNYLEKALTPEEKQITLFRMKENNRRYENPINKYQALIMGAMLILTMLLLIGIVYTTVTYVKNIKVTNELAKENKEIAQAQKNSVDGLTQVGETLVQVASLLTDGQNIVRQVS